MAVQLAVTLDAGQLLAGVVALAAFLAALAYLVRLGRRFARTGRAVWRLVDQELTHNHGTSMKDDVYGIAVSVGELSRKVDDLSHDLYHHLAEKDPKTP